MPNQQNPYHPPAESDPLLTKGAINWKLFGWLNLAIVTALGALALVSFLWFKYEQAQMTQQLGRHYATYDHEYHFYPVNGLIFIALVFGIPNIIMLVVQSRGRRHPPQ